MATVNPLMMYYQGADDRESALARQQERQFQQSERQRLTSLRDVAGKALSGQKDALPSLAALDPETYMQVSKYQTEQQKAAQQRFGQDALSAIMYVKEAPDNVRPQLYAKTAAQLNQMYPGANIPLEYDPQYLAQQEEILLKDAYPELYAKVMERKVIPAEPKYQQVGDALLEIPAEAGGAPRVAYRAPRQAPIQGQTERQRDFAYYSGLNPQQRAEYDRLYGKSGGMSVTLPDGTVVQQGGPAMKLTEQQSKDIGFYNRGISAQDTLSTNESALTNLRDAAVSGIPGAGNYMVSPQYQAAQQSAREFLAAILRKDTGAAITNTEMEIYGKMYLPQPGDSPATLEQKKQSRETALDALKTGLGTATPLAAERKAPKQAGPSVDDLLRKYGQ